MNPFSRWLNRRPTPQPEHQCALGDACMQDVYVQVTCCACGPVPAVPALVDLTVYTKDPGRTSYTFDCPDCGAHVTRAASPDTVTLLIGAAVPTRRNHTPPETINAATRVGPVITRDDVLDFALGDLDMAVRRLTAGLPYDWKQQGL